MKKILCFGDSNTYGFVPGFGTRFSINERWSGIFKQALEKTNNYTVIEEGYNGRTCFSLRTPAEACAIKILPQYLNNDIDIVIFQVGINDTKDSFNLNEEKIKKGFLSFLNLAKNCAKNAEIYVLSPPQIDENILLSLMFNRKSIETAKKLIEIFKTVSMENDCNYIDLNNIVKVSIRDGLHYDKESHLKIAQHLIQIFNG